MTTPYNPQVPQTGDFIADSQPSFLNNFIDLFAAFNTNHISLTDPANPGNHNVIQLVEQAAGDSTFSQEVAIYSKKVVGQTDQLFLRYPNNGKEIQLTQFQIFELNQTANQNSYFSFLPGGIVVYFGLVVPNSNEFTINLIPPICTNIMGVNLCPVGDAATQNFLFQSNVKTFTTLNGKVSGMIITNSTSLFIPPPTQYYIIFGNI